MFCNNQGKENIIFPSIKMQNQDWISIYQNLTKKHNKMMQQEKKKWESLKQALLTTEDLDDFIKTVYSEWLDVEYIYPIKRPTPLESIHKFLNQWKTFAKIDLQTYHHIKKILETEWIPKKKSFLEKWFPFR